MGVAGAAVVVGAAGAERAAAAGSVAEVSIRSRESIRECQDDGIMGRAKYFDPACVFRVAE